MRQLIVILRDIVRMFSKIGNFFFFDNWDKNAYLAIGMESFNLTDHDCDSGKRPIFVFHTI